MTAQQVILQQQGLRGSTGSPTPSHTHELRLLQFFEPFDLSEAVAVCQAYGYTGMLVKALDGVDWMSRYDASTDAISNVEELADQADFVRSQGLYYFAWTNPLASVEIALEATLTGQVARACDGVFLDVEPYAQFWGADRPAGLADQFMQWVRLEAPDSFLALQPDPRGSRLGEIKAWEWMRYCDVLAGQHYWSDFSTDPSQELTYAAQLSEVYGVPVLPTLPGNASAGSFPSDQIDAFPGFVVWRYGSTPSSVLAQLGGLHVQGLHSEKIADRA